MSPRSLLVHNCILGLALYALALVVTGQALRRDLVLALLLCCGAYAIAHLQEAWGGQPWGDTGEACPEGGLQEPWEAQAVYLDPPDRKAPS